MDGILKQILFWGVWLIIPFLIDILVGLISGGYMITRKVKTPKEKTLDFYPSVTILVPVYNSSKTLEALIKSIINSDYPLKDLQVFLIDNGSKDESREVYYRLQTEYPKLRMWWLDSSQGKAKALNKGLYMAEGKYIINIDSDGILEKNAIKNVVYDFENNDEIAAMTGVIVTNHEDIKKEKSLLMKLIQKCELLEYCEAFIIGRGFQSATNTMFTLAGAFSAFRKEVVLKTQLYNGETLGEDTHMTTQIREFLHKKIALCEDAFFITEPIESLNKLYVQRQRWQRGGIEVSTLFNKQYSGTKMNWVLRLAMIQDHTLIFPRLIWLFGMVYLIFIGYPMKLIVGANVILYLSYVILSIFYIFITRMYLHKYKELRKFIGRNFLVILLLPIYRMFMFVIRAAGVINAIESDSKWKTKTFTEEKEEVKKEVKKRFKLYYKIKKWVNGGLFNEE